MIESGLDISNVNTIIIEKPTIVWPFSVISVKRKSRKWSSRQAYAYLLLDDFKNISESL